MKLPPSYDRWITDGYTHRCGCGATYTDADGGCDRAFPCINTDCDGDVICDGSHPDDREWTTCDECDECAWCGSVLRKSQLAPDEDGDPSCPDCLAKKTTVNDEAFATSTDDALQEITDE